MADTQPHGEPTGPFPVWSDPDAQSAGVAPEAHTNDPIAAAHWDEHLWHNSPFGR